MTDDVRLKQAGAFGRFHWQCRAGSRRPPRPRPDRRVRPFAGDRPEPERSLTWLAGNVNKRGITCGLETESGRALFARLAERADVVVESFRPGTLAALGLGYEALAARNT